MFYSYSGFETDGKSVAVHYPDNRLRKFALRKPAGTFRIVALGDSLTEEWNLPGFVNYTDFLRDAAGRKFLAGGFGAEGPAVRPAQGTALGNGSREVRVSAQRANDSMNGWPVGPTTSFSCTTASQGDALGWANGWAFGPQIHCERCLPRLPKPSQSTAAVAGNEPSISSRRAFFPKAAMARRKRASVSWASISTKKR